MVMSTANMECCMALQAGSACAFGRFAQLADCVVSKCWGADTLYHVETSRVAELDFRMPKGTAHVNPIVVSSAFEWLTRNQRSAFLQLAKAVFFFGLVDKLLLQPLLFSVTIRLFLMCDLWLLIKVLLGILLRAQNTFVGLMHVSRSFDTVRM